MGFSQVVRMAQRMRVKKVSFLFQQMYMYIMILYLFEIAILFQK